MIRYFAVTVMLRVLAGASLTTALPPAVQQLKDSRDQALLKALVYEMCRWYFRLEAILEKCLQRPLKAKDQDVRVVLLLGLCQLLILDISPHAAVTETVAVCDRLKKTWAKSLVNGVLRNFLREKENILAKCKDNPFVRYAHPLWMIDKIQQDWPSQADAIFAANNQHPPMTLRVNLEKISRDAYCQKLNNGAWGLLSDIPSAIQLISPVNVEALPGFAEGLVSVQDGAAQLAAPLLSPQVGDCILDACAAPGGKTVHLLEYQPQLKKLIAIDQDALRLQRVAENLSRLHYHCDLVVADAADTTTWWDGQPFDRILLDAPCSASGVVRRHPDIRLLRRETDIALLAQSQLRLLTALWPLLKIGGHLLYVTCSIFRDENERVIETFLQTQATAQPRTIHAGWGVACSVGRQILPGQEGMDGFYYCLLKKIEVK
ncbi:MAG: 16S rRNA (cytosine(967)-C(5))-methyltransferase RsmB [Gammaproteobacteria bacterium]|nr:16S rRNA (cytosine(967)-C(5))-methyltransferase RsmB [Gammaproteobacteria bacterium]